MWIEHFLRKRTHELDVINGIFDPDLERKLFSRWSPGMACHRAYGTTVKVRQWGVILAVDEDSITVMWPMDFRT